MVSYLAHEPPPSAASARSWQPESIFQKSFTVYLVGGLLAIEVSILRASVSAGRGARTCREV